METARCDAPVRVANVFIGAPADTGHRCQRARGHDGPHRWSAGWEDLPPADVEALLARDAEVWEPDE